MRLSLAVLLLAIPALACAQDMYKCADAKGKITYMSQTCESMRLKSAGEVKGQISVTPTVVPQGLPPSPPPQGQQSAAQPASKPAAQPPAPAPADGDAGGDKRCFKTAKGTRCNETPEEPQSK